VRGFTSISERLAPEVLANLLNEYFTPMTDIVLQSGGLLDKYIGDALMAVWGAPLHMPDHADRALHSSLRMLDALDKLTESWKERNLPTIDIGCGINTGPMVVGNMGSTQRFDYTVLGDAVNLGSRLEGITKEYGVRVICSNSTRQNLKRPEDFILRELDWIKVKGKNEPITIYEVMRFHPEKKDVALKTKELFEQGLKLYRERDFAGAMQQMLKILQYAAQDGPASVFLERCEYYAENPPTENWDGVWVMKTK
jgi:adenylate cyclase